MNYGEIKESDIANGIGVRTTLFVSGCRRHCPDCFQPQTWDFNYGNAFTKEVADEVIASLEPGWIDGLTVLGGEPMEPENQRELVSFLRRVREAQPAKSIWLYSGFTYDELTGDTDANTHNTDELLGYLDVLVDGPFDRDKKDITLRFRGSSNQRIIDVPATRAAGEVVLWEDDPVFATHTM